MSGSAAPPARGAAHAPQTRRSRAGCGTRAACAARDPAHAPPARGEEHAPQAPRGPCGTRHTRRRRGARNTRRLRRAGRRGSTRAAGASSDLAPPVRSVAYLGRHGLVEHAPPGWRRAGLGTRAGAITAPVRGERRGARRGESAPLSLTCPHRCLLPRHTRRLRRAGRGTLAACAARDAAHSQPARGAEHVPPAAPAPPRCQCEETLTVMREL